ncbi:hypothetical protein IFM89_005602 [Coptis chinensis]|uniref:Uncharacterized protein n=1 Tax=Coptis chinensis TaxID=261450 RepID=A0A835IC40_9MAGN|nr:hypothetical protein IFM89_005602 [Coptis chinensis]
MEYGAIKKPSSQDKSRLHPQAQVHQHSSPSNALTLHGIKNREKEEVQKALVVVGTSGQPKGQNGDIGLSLKSTAISTSALIERSPSKWPRPEWHAPWKNYRVISGHLGWVRSIAFDPSNTWFCR